MEIDNKIIVLFSLGILMFILGFTIQFINMMIDHQCYQLEPNDFYNKTICERYWKDGDK